MKLLVLSLCLLQVVFGGPVRKDGPVPNTPENSKYKKIIFFITWTNIQIFSTLVAIIASGNYKQNIEELSGQFEGDMVLTTDQERMLNGMDRTGLIDTSYRWPNNTVSYILSDIFSQAQKDYIELGLRELERVSCLRFVPRTTEETFVSVEVSKMLIF